MRVLFYLNVCVSLFVIVVFCYVLLCVCLFAVFFFVFPIGLMCLRGARFRHVSGFSIVLRCG